MFFGCLRKSRSIGLHVGTRWVAGNAERNHPGIEFSHLGKARESALLFLFVPLLHHTEPPNLHVHLLRKQARTSVTQPDVARNQY